MHDISRLAKKFQSLVSSVNKKKLLSNSAIIDEHYNTKAALNNAIVTDIYHIIILHLCHAIMLMLI